MIYRRHLLAITSALCLSTQLGTAAAQAPWPERPVRLVIGFAPGGATDILARTLATKLSERWNQPVVVDNKPGGNTIIAAQETIKAKPDGYTLSLVLDMTLVMNQHLFKNPKYNPFEDFTVLGQVAEFPMVLMSRKAARVNSFEEFVRIAKTKPDDSRVAIAAVLNTVALKLIGASAGIDPPIVQYKGTGDATLGLLRGDVNYQLDASVGALPHIQSGDINVLAVTSPRRVSVHPDAPTLAELGHPSATMTGWFGFVGPKGVPSAVVQKFNADLRWAMQDTKVLAVLAERAIVPAITSPDEMVQRMKRDSEKYGAVIRSNNLSFD